MNLDRAIFAFAGVMILAATYAVVNFLADLAYVMLDKRISYA